MKILTVDIGTGTQDIFLHDSKLDIENGFKLVLPSPTMMVHRRLKQALHLRTPVLLTGHQMGGGPSAWAIEEYVRAGIPVYMTPSAATTLNDELDTSLFKQNRAGYLIDSSWNLAALANAIGKQNLAVDAWPALPGGYLSGYVKAESLYLNVNTAGDSTENHLVTLQFMGYLMTVPVQEFLAEQGFIPSMPAAQPRDPLLAQAHAAFARGTAYPAVLLSKDGALRLIYQDILDAALVDVFKNGVAPRVALENALQDIEQRLEELK